MKPILIYMTALNAQAEELCAGLLREKLIACANIMPPHKAMYVWDGEVKNHQDECVVVLKSTDNKFSEIERYVTEYHDYDVPCLVQIDILGGHAPYLDWIKSAVDPSYS